MTTEQVNKKYTGTIYPGHPGGIRNIYPGGGGYAADAFDGAYTRAMLQAALAA